MVNDEVNNKAINIEIKVAEYSAKAIFKAIKKIMEDAAEKSQPLADYLSEKRKTNSRRLKDMVKKGQLEEIPVEEAELKELKKELNRYGVKFSVMKDKESEKYSVFFQAKDMKVMDKAFKHALSESEKKTERKESIHKNIEKFKEMAKNSVSKDKVKNKQKEQSL